MYHPILPLIPNEEGAAPNHSESTHQPESIWRRLSPQRLLPAGARFRPQHRADRRGDPGASLAPGQRRRNTGTGPSTRYRTSRATTATSPFLRGDLLSNRISFHNLAPGDFLASLRALRGGRKDIYVVTAMDAETFGHHIPGTGEEQFLAQTFREIAWNLDGSGGRANVTPDDRVRVVTISDLQNQFPRGDVVMPKPSSWSTSGDDLTRTIHSPCGTARVIGPSSAMGCDQPDHGRWFGAPSQSRITPPVSNPRAWLGPIWIGRCTAANSGGRAAVPCGRSIWFTGV